jgi:hypothetical protein
VPPAPAAAAGSAASSSAQQQQQQQQQQPSPPAAHAQAPRWPEPGASLYTPAAAIPAVAPAVAVGSAAPPPAVAAGSVAQPPLPNLPFDAGQYIIFLQEESKEGHKGLRWEPVRPFTCEWRGTPGHVGKFSMSFPTSWTLVTGQDPHCVDCAWR